MSDENNNCVNVFQATPTSAEPQYHLCQCSLNLGGRSTLRMLLMHTLNHERCQSSEKLSQL